MNEPERPNTPSAVKRQLRQESGFGCCVCGVPILQYHHIIEWAIEKHFRPDDMMALCPNHHDQASKGAMPEAKQRAYKKSPFNKGKGFAGGLLAVKQDYAALQLGSVTMVNDGPFLMVNGEALLEATVAEGELRISLHLRSKSGELLCEIVDNEWVTGEAKAWDIEADWNKLIIREKRGSINLRLDLRVVPARVKGSFWSGDANFKIDEKGVSFADDYCRLPTKISEFGLAGIRLEVTGKDLRLEPDGLGSLELWPTARLRLEKTRDAWRRMKNNV